MSSNNIGITRLGLSFAGLKPKKLAEINAKLLIQGEWLNQDLVADPEALLEFNRTTEKVLQDIGEFARLPGFGTYYFHQMHRNRSAYPLYLGMDWVDL